MLKVVAIMCELANPENCLKYSAPVVDGVMQPICVMMVQQEFNKIFYLPDTMELVKLTCVPYNEVECVTKDTNKCEK